MKVDTLINFFQQEMRANRNMLKLLQINEQTQLALNYVQKINHLVELNIKLADEFELRLCDGCMTVMGNEKFCKVCKHKNNI
jgi:RNase P subunit RPR2